jgi:hypothetical protein
MKVNFDYPEHKSLYQDDKWYMIRQSDKTDEPHCAIYIIPYAKEEEKVLYIFNDGGIGHSSMEFLYDSGYTYIGQINSINFGVN